MRCFLRRAGLLAPIVFVTAIPLAAQEGPPVGAHDYRVDGAYEGEAMFPWASQIVVADTVIYGDSALAIVYNSRDDGAGGWRFTYWTTLRAGETPSPAAVWTGVGRGGAVWCEVTVEGGMLRFTDYHGEQESGPHEGMLIPDFAVPAAVALQDLEAGMTFPLSPYRCSSGANTQGPSTVRVWNVDASVAEGTYARPYRGEVPVWIVRTEGDFVVEVIVDQADRMVLQVTTQQGAPESYSRERYVRSE